MCRTSYITFPCSVHICCFLLLVLLFFFNDTATTEIYTLSLHDALPISRNGGRYPRSRSDKRRLASSSPKTKPTDRKSTRLNSSHRCISYAVFCLKKKKKQNNKRNNKEVM